MTSPLVIMLLLFWATIAGIDLATVPQGLLSRPLVAATVAGAIVGNVESGLLAGMVLELYALDVLPIGAARYPDFGAASVAAGVASAVVPVPLVAGIAGVVALPVAVFGGWTIQRLRRFNGASVQRRLERVAAGDARAIWELQRNGLLRDTARSFLLGICALLIAAIAMSVTWENVARAEWLSWATIAGGLIAAIGGALRSAGQGARRRWYAVGLATGVAVVLLG